LSMGTKAALPVAEYLQTSFPDLDKEYRDGELVERSLPDNLHSKTQGLLIAFFVALRKAFPLFTRPELRLKIRPGLYLIPDVAIFHPAEPQQPVPDNPPFVTIEVLSIDDKMARVREKLEEYRSWGVPHVWLVDPHSKRLYTCDAGLVEVPTLQIPELGIDLTPADIFE
jgi:Uma2 family endonuclease